MEVSDGNKYTKFKRIDQEEPTTIDINDQQIDDTKSCIDSNDSKKLCNKKNRRNN